MTQTPTPPKTDKNKNLQIWLQTISMGFALASVGIVIAVLLKLFLGK